jgi:hypothetical protein
MSIDKVRGTQLLFKIEDGSSPPAFAHPCLINAKRGIQFQSSTNKIIVPDCENPDDPAWQECTVDGLSATITGAGKLDAAAVVEYDAWYRSGESKSVQVWIGTKGHWPGDFKLTNWALDGDRNDYANVNVTLESDGELGAYVTA